MLGFFSSRPNWGPLPPRPQASVSPPTLVSWGEGANSLLGEVFGGPNSDILVPRYICGSRPKIKPGTFLAAGRLAIATAPVSSWVI